MGYRREFKLLMRQHGYSIVEVMIAMVLLAFIALAILPAMSGLRNSLKIQSFRTQCNAMVRAKIQEYVNGVSATGLKDVDPVASGYISSGFEYAKKRYYDMSELDENGINYCQYSDSSSSTVNAGYPGFRERISSNKIVSFNAPGNEDPLIIEVPRSMKGFQLFVNVRHYNPRVNVGEQPRRQCPQTDPPYKTPHDYQFLRLGDAIEVVVTGMIRTTPPVAEGGRGGESFGSLQDVNDNTPNPRLVCSSSQIIYPPSIPFRYYLGVDGKIRNYQATLGFTAGAPDASLESMEAHFRHLWSLFPDSDGTIESPVQANIRSFAVSPENDSVYMLRPGELKQYRNCTDQTVTMTKLDGTTFEQPQIPDCSLANADIYTWGVDSNFDNIAVNFNKVASADGSHLDDDEVFGFFNTGGNAAGEIRKLNITLPPAADDRAVAIDASFTVPADRPRIRGIFMSPTFPPASLPDVPNIFYFDNTCAEEISSTAKNTHCISVFNSSDTAGTRPVTDFPVQVEGISD